MRPVRTAFSTLLAVAAIGCGPAGEREPAGRVILFSWDGTAHWATEEVLERAELPVLSRFVEEGAWADGMVSSFPTKTAAAHAMIWTGRYGHQNGVTANSLLLQPAAEHTRLESTSGYFGDALEAEPLWTMTARAGLRTYALHATQSYPFEGAGRWLPAERAESLELLYGYTRQSQRSRVYSHLTNPVSRATGWTVEAARSPAAREIALELGDDRWWGLFFDDPADSRQGLDTLGLARSKEAIAFDLVLRPGLDAPISPPIAVSAKGVTLNSTLRLFELEPNGQSYLLYRASAEALVASSDDFPGGDTFAEQAFAGNGAGWAYGVGDLGPTIPQGGDGVAEDRFLRTLADLADQLRAQAKPVLDRADYRLVILYSPILDDATHTWAGYLDPGMPGHDPELAERLWPKLAAAYRTHERMLADVMAAAERDGATVLLVSDHGMAGTNRLFNVNVALERAGLLKRTASAAIDLAETRALLLPLADASVAVNTADRAGGIVPLDQREAVLADVRQALEAVIDPRTGEPIVTSIYDAATSGDLQPGGPTTGDLFLDLAPGYYFSDRLDPDEVVTVSRPMGNHIFLPTRRDMLSICGVWGAGAPSGADWARVRSIDIAPTVLRLLGLPLPEDLPGRALLDRVAQ
jgi:predicted AlkP superfamily phosphohydrolase/phosphomutase